MRMAAIATIALATFGCRKPFDPVEAAHVEQTALAASSPAPDAQVTMPSGANVALTEVLRRHPRNVVVFYRGFF
jgi:hypothetical protein